VQLTAAHQAKMVSERALHTINTKFTALFLPKVIANASCLGCAKTFVTFESGIRGADVASHRQLHNSGIGSLLAQSLTSSMIEMT
jgi:hypothetical protein